MRIVWPGGSRGEMRDWSRRDMMIKDGKTVKALVHLEDERAIRVEMGMDMGSAPLMMGPLPVWDNIGWTRLY